MLSFYSKVIITYHSAEICYDYIRAHAHQASKLRAEVSCYRAVQGYICISMFISGFFHTKETGECSHRSHYLSHAKRAFYHVS